MIMAELIGSDLRRNDRFTVRQLAQDLGCGILPDELLVPVPLQPMADHRALEHIQIDEATALQRQPWSGSIV